MKPGIFVGVSPMNVSRSPSSSRQAGLSLIEVLMAVLLVSIGLLGAAGMHVRAIQFTTDTERRQMASMVASELMETMRGDTLTVLQTNGTPKADLGGYAKAMGTELDAVTVNDCQPLAAIPAKRLGCWGARARQLMPELPAALVTSNFVVGLDAGNGVISVTVAWPVKKGQCLDGTDNDFCSYTLRSRL
ncbi:type IV pilus modification protein PilV [Variovorax sp. GB1P17]|uniref:type IV pilus modification protein PilV n=1 Tax=Variovorax sp. GB1P17 TaxID=3443740 RepID=UPI003F475A50